MPECVWHITFSTYAARLPGSAKLTVDKHHNQPGDMFVDPHPQREAVTRSNLNASPIVLSRDQRLFIQATLPDICVRGKWYHIASAVEPNHVHVIVASEWTVPSEKIRSLLRRWLGQALDGRWRASVRPDGGKWWSDGGSTRAIKEHDYLVAAVHYVHRQRCE